MADSPHQLLARDSRDVLLPGAQTGDLRRRDRNVCRSPDRASAWEHMSRAGKRVAVIDAPFGRPTDGLNGVQITNWGVHDSWSWPRSSWPSGLIHEVVDRFGEHPVPYCDAPDPSLADYEVLRAGLIEGVRRKANLLRHHLAQEDWDFFLGVFSESHCAGHQFWHLMDPSHPRHAASAPPSLHWTIRDVYRAIDAGVGGSCATCQRRCPFS